MISVTYAWLGLEGDGRMARRFGATGLWWRLSVVRGRRKCRSIYRTEGLPPVTLEPPTPGEQRVVNACGGIRLLQRIHQPRIRYSYRKAKPGLTAALRAATIILPTKSEPERECGIPASFSGSSG